MVKNELAIEALKKSPARRAPFEDEASRRGRRPKIRQISKLESNFIA
jgi:hypothetical protein